MHIDPDIHINRDARNWVLLCRLRSWFYIWKSYVILKDKLNLFFWSNLYVPNMCVSRYDATVVQMVS
jgi:hypothetical protein